MAFDFPNVKTAPTERRIWLISVLQSWLLIERIDKALFVCIDKPWKGGFSQFAKAVWLLKPPLGDLGVKGQQIGLKDVLA